MKNITLKMKSVCEGLIIFVFLFSFSLSKGFRMEPKVVVHYPPESHKENELEEKRVNDSDVGLNAVELITKYGYIAEEHTDILTEDGYILEMHRIPHGRKGESITNMPLLIMHGLLSNSQDFVNNGPDRSLAYLAADEGYDVWLGNCRGNRYTRRHIQYNATDDADFWDFSWHEMGVYDLPVMIDYVLNATGQSKLLYIGHSQGIAALLVLLSEKPEYNSKIQFVSAMGPAVFLTRLPNTLLRLVAKNMSPISPFLRLLQMDVEVSRHRFPISMFCNRCQNPSFKNYCANILFFILGPSDQIDLDKLPVYTSSIPAGSSTKQVKHFTQSVRTDTFSKYDYGRVDNLRRYGTAGPPSYDLTKATVPIAVYSGQSDALISLEDTKELVEKLPNVVRFYVIPSKKWNHADFLWAKDAPNLLYIPMLKLMREYIDK